MADRSFIDKQYTLLKGVTKLWPVFNVGAAGAVTLQKWNYPSLGQGSAAWTYTAAPTTGGGTAWPVADVAGADGVRSVTRTGTGAWTITLQDSYHRLLGVDCMFTASAGGGAPASSPACVAVQVLGNLKGGSNGDVTLQTGGTIKLLFQSAAATAADPASGEQIILEITLQNKSEP